MPAKIKSPRQLAYRLALEAMKRDIPDEDLKGLSISVIKDIATIIIDRDNLMEIAERYFKGELDLNDA